MLVTTGDHPTPVLVVHPDRKAQRLLQRILATTLRPVEVVEPAAATQRAAADPAAIVVVDHTTAAGLGAPGAAGAPGDRWIAVPSDEAVPAAPDVVAALVARGWRHVLAAPLARCGDELGVTVQRLRRGAPAGIEQVLGWAAEVQDRTVEDASQRPAAVADLVAGVIRAGLSERVASLASVIADELLANAIHGAPVDAAGARPFRDAPRDASRPLAADGRPPPRLRWGADARLLAVEVTDGWGSLDPAVPGPLIARASRRGRGDDAPMGLALAYACCHQLAFAIVPGRSTTVTASLDVSQRPSELGRAPSFHLFVGQGARS